MQPYHTLVGLRVSVQRSHSLALLPHPHQHHPLPASSRPTTLQWHTIRQLQPRQSLSRIVKRHHHRQTQTTALVLGLLLYTISMPHNTATHYKLHLHPSRHQDRTFQDHQRQARALLVHRVCTVQTRRGQCRVHHKVRRRLHHLHLRLHQANTMAIPHHLPP